MPLSAVKKLKMAKSIHQTVYMYSATGYGKTRLIKEFFDNKRHFYFSCHNGFWNSKDIPNGGKTKAVVIIDDLHMLKDEEKRREVTELIKREDLWFILISRSIIPKWLMNTYIKKGFIVINENDLKFSKEDIAKYLSLYEIKLNEKELLYLRDFSYGNAFAVIYTARRLSEGAKLNKELSDEISKSFIDYLKRCIIPQWDTDITEFLMKMSVVDSFNEKLAEIITGDIFVGNLIEKAFYTGNFMREKGGVYTLIPIMNNALKSLVKSRWDEKRINEYVYNAGLYFEMQEMYMQALEMYNRCGNNNRIRDLLIRNASRNPGNGHYFEMRKYYFLLDENDIKTSVVLMSAMSMLYSMLLQIEKSEYWYNKLKEHAGKAGGAEWKEAKRYLKYLDIALPHRGSKGIFSIIKGLPVFINSKGMKLPEFSVTSNLPSTMNGGKDFCEWSKHDKEIAAAIGKLTPMFLGKYSKGLVSVALGESFYEKGCNDFEVIQLLSKAKIEAEAGGKLEIVFASVGLQARYSICEGNYSNAENMLNSFEKTILENKATRMLMNLNALRCRISLYKGDRGAVNEWLENEAPDETLEFYCMDRYRYLTKVRCYIASGEHTRAISLIGQLRQYAELCSRTYIKMELDILTAIIKYREKMEWKTEFTVLLKKISEYSFVRILTEECTAVLDLLKKMEKDISNIIGINKNWFDQVMKESSKMSTFYPSYLRKGFIKTSEFSQNAIEVLRFQAKGVSQSEIAKRLGISVNTVKYHIKQNYIKLGVSNKAEALIEAKNFNLI